eukprot:gnl/MRDRNA2_/MRDRNA2_114641_c0_seq1.p1 gnl/MRDRNA2_/MRDRNA2_114641_c0~~gnl/MRDRNA2_/MRDRNA2_114641_c0_seq1.p1  ORF type:complete len:574 (-),score=89.35 gnl/MRDRNA2_/MRDRNA2_114641_c0_seq1:8-1729(-)
MVEPSHVFAEPLLQEAGQRNGRSIKKAFTFFFLVFGLGFTVNLLPWLPQQEDASKLAIEHMRPVTALQFPQLATSRWQTSQPGRTWPLHRQQATWQYVQPALAAETFSLGSAPGGALVGTSASALRLGTASHSASRASHVFALKKLESAPALLSEFVETNSGVQMPRLIYTTVSQKESTEVHVQSAVRGGFRGIQTASQPTQYSEAGVGAALTSLFASGIERSSLFIQTSVNPEFAAELGKGFPIGQQVEMSIKRSLSNLGLDFVDSLLLDSPYPEHDQTQEAWRAMEDAVQAGLVRQLGISNVNSLEKLERLYLDATLKPAVVQENFQGQTGVCDMQECAVQEWCVQHGIYLQSFMTLNGDMRPTVSKTMRGLSKKYSSYDATPYSLYFRYMMGLGIVPLTATFSQEHMKEDLAAWRIPLEVEDAAAIEHVLEQSDHVLQLPQPQEEAEEDEVCFLNSAGESGQVTNLTGLGEFRSAQRCTEERLVVYKFFAPWCRACKAMGIKFAKLATEYTDARFFQVDYEKNKDVCKSLGVKVLPYVEIYRGENRLEGFSCGPSKVPKLAQMLANFSKA